MKENFKNHFARVCCLAVAVVAVQPLIAADIFQETVDGTQWTYMVQNKSAVLGGEAGSAVPKNTTGCIVVPETLGGFPVAVMKMGAFVFGPENATNATTLVFPSSLKSLSSFACVGEELERGGVAPYSVCIYAPPADYGVEVAFKGNAPLVVDDSESVFGGEVSFYRFKHGMDNGNVSSASMFRGITLGIAGGSSWGTYSTDGFLGGKLTQRYAMVEFEPKSGTEFCDTLDVRLSCNVADVPIYYTLDGSEPTTNSALYTPGVCITLDGSATVKAIAIVDSHDFAMISEASYTRNGNVVRDIWKDGVIPEGFGFVETNGVWSVVFGQGGSDGTGGVDGDGIACVKAEAEPGKTASIVFRVSEKGTLKFKWRLSSVLNEETSGVSYAMCTADELHDPKWSIKGDDQDASSEKEVEVGVNDIDSSGFALIRISFTSKDFNRCYREDCLYVGDFTWEPFSEESGENPEPEPSESPDDETETESPENPKGGQEGGPSPETQDNSQNEGE